MYIMSYFISIKTELNTFRYQLKYFFKRNSSFFPNHLWLYRVLWK